MTPIRSCDSNLRRSPRRTPPPLIHSATNVNNKLSDHTAINLRITNRSWEGIYVRPSPISGSGLFANATFEKGSAVIDYHGPLISESEAETLNGDERMLGSLFYFSMNKDKNASVICGFEKCKCHNQWSNLGFYMNHNGINFNVEPRNFKTDKGESTIVFTATRKILPHEELTYNYGDTRTPLVQRPNWYYYCLLYNIFYYILYYIILY